MFDLFAQLENEREREDMTNERSSVDFIFVLILLNSMMTRRKWWKILIGTWRKEEIFWERTRWYTLFICQKKMNGTKLDRDKSDKTFLRRRRRTMDDFRWCCLFRLPFSFLQSSKITIFKTMFSLQERSSGTEILLMIFACWIASA